MHRNAQNVHIYTQNIHKIHPFPCHRYRIHPPPEAHRSRRPGIVVVVFRHTGGMSSVRIVERTWNLHKFPLKQPYIPLFPSRLWYPEGGSFRGTPPLLYILYHFGKALGRGACVGGTSLARPPVAVLTRGIAPTSGVSLRPLSARGPCPSLHFARSIRPGQSPDLHAPSFVPLRPRPPFSGRFAPYARVPPYG